jgi:RES domain-containing protein
MFADRALRARLRTVPLVDVTGTFHRNLLLRYLSQSPPGAPLGTPPDPLWAGGAALLGARFTPTGGPDTLYLAEDPVTALAEVGAILDPSGKGAPAGPPRVDLSCRVELAGVLDLTDANTLAACGTTLAEVTGTWMLHPSGDAPTQRLGRAAHASRRIHAIRFWSAHRVGVATCLAVFPDRLGPGELVEVHDPSGHLVRRLP